jgi:hypothetical protein
MSLIASSFQVKYYLRGENVSCRRERGASRRKEDPALSGVMRTKEYLIYRLHNSYCTTDGLLLSLSLSLQIIGGEREERERFALTLATFWPGPSLAAPNGHLAHLPA